MQCRIAPSLGGGFAGTPNDVWGTTDYTDKHTPTVFFGMYGLPDLMALRAHQGKAYVLWAGSDIRHFANGYWLDDQGKHTIQGKVLSQWLSEKAEHYVENQVEADALAEYGISATVVPSFLGNIDDYPILNNIPEDTHLYTSVSGDDFELYGWDKIDELAFKNPAVTFHLYGNEKPWPTDLGNVVVHGRVSQEEMNEEIQKMSGALRLTEFDGFSEILAKSVLWGQWPVSTIPYEHMLSVADIGTIDTRDTNVAGSLYYRTILNNYPWNVNFNKETQ